MVLFSGLSGCQIFDFLLCFRRVRAVAVTVKEKNRRSVLVSGGDLEVGGDRGFCWFEIPVTSRLALLFPVRCTRAGGSINHACIRARP